MHNIKQKILGVLQNEKNTEAVLDDLSNCQDNLLKNFLKSVFNKEDKNEILKQYNNLQSLGKSLYRYSNAKENNDDAATERNKQNAENILLKGGISYNRYIWHSENGEHACDECKALDGKIFDFYEEVPDPPHPNYKCRVEIIENKKENENYEDIILKNKTSSKIYQKEKSSVLQAKQKTEKEGQETKIKKWSVPCEGFIVGKYGEQRTTHVHNGIDIAVPVGTPVKAIADGIIYYAGDNDPKGYGKYVIIEHQLNGRIITSEYGHLSSWNVKVGQKIKQDEIIAKSGNTGHSHGPHVHLTIREGKYKGTSVNPSKYINY